jgi:dTDP-4-amino-4,6-dideoxygalactose transaminase
MPEGSGLRKRDEVIRMLASLDIETRAYFYPPVHEQQMFCGFSYRTLGRTEDLARRVITLPFYTSITSGEMDYVVDGLQSAAKRIL